MRETVLFGNVHLDEPAFMDGQLDRAEAEPRHFSAQPLQNFRAGRSLGSRRPGRRFVHHRILIIVALGFNLL